jgi:hypothetical protein
LVTPVSSTILGIEASLNPGSERRRVEGALLSLANEVVVGNQGVADRADRSKSKGSETLDALYPASSEQVAQQKVCSGKRRKTPLSC